jgi:hypothetical protein
MSRFTTAAKAALGAASLAIAILVAPVGAASGAGTDTAPGVARARGAVTAAEQQQVRDYWTPARMRSAVPRDQVVKVVPTAKPAGSTSKAVKVSPPPAEFGKVFFTLEGVNYVCSGTVTESAKGSLVNTAGHCVNEGPGVFASSFAFVPAYENGARPYGTWVARQLLTTNEWALEGDFDYDVGFAVMNVDPVTKLTLVATTGRDYPIAFGLDYGLSFVAYGYPAAKPFNGQYLYKCTGTSGLDLLGGTTDHSLPCTMTGGSSGGGWITSDHLNSLNSFKYTIDPKTMYGPYFGNVVEDLYTTAAGS